MRYIRQDERDQFNAVVRGKSTDHWYKILAQIDDRRYRAWAACVIWGSYVGNNARPSAEYSALMDSCPGLGTYSNMCEDKLWDYMNEMGIPSISRK